MENTTDILSYALIGLIVWCIILYFIIQAATKSKQLARNSEKQIKLLMKIAERSGVPQSEIMEAIKDEEQKENL